MEKNPDINRVLDKWNNYNKKRFFNVVVDEFIVNDSI